ncbi:hypothetical protein BDP27DRAFT_1337301 [Rhodocollybia butyracea]|uniref:NAD(P)-binding protein n=1 Tax=Rhodocollybia butyracea TaxID=206335 RepID=A0A9P5U0Z6_9AGAR|nr:hypothetical protein BDP27DRAFT_1337301 [Rhodocollybia butyracea]
MAPSLAAARAINAAFSPSYIPVAVFVGGTSGVGQGMAEAFARHTKGNAHIILIGRNSSAADSFVACDITLMKNVQKTTEELIKRVPRINFLVISSGVMNLNGRDETEEGIDRKLAVHYYARWKFIHGLVPALVKANEGGEDAKVFSVFSPGNAKKIDLDDLGLKKTFSLSNAALQGSTYNDLMIEGYASRYPSLSFIHSYPGGVRTNLTASSTSAIVRALDVKSRWNPFRYLTISQEDAGEYLLSGLFKAAPGAWRHDNHGNDMGKKGYYGDEESQKKLWEHTVQVTGSEQR